MQKSRAEHKLGVLEIRKASGQSKANKVREMTKWGRKIARGQITAGPGKDIKSYSKRQSDTDPA